MEAATIGRRIPGTRHAAGWVRVESAAGGPGTRAPGPPAATRSASDPTFLQKVAHCRAGMPSLAEGRP
jgi:hypothetical protein